MTGPAPSGSAAWSVRTGVLLALALGVVLVATRLVVLATSLDLYEIEEGYIGMLGKEAKDSLFLPYLWYLGSDDIHHAGVMLNGLLLGATYSLFGESWVTMKLTWLACSLGSFVALFVLAWRRLNPRVALIAGLLFVFGPPFLIWFNLSDTGTENGAMLLTVLLTLAWSGVDSFATIRPWRAAALGLFSGLALCFSHYLLLALFAAAAYHTWRDWRLPSRPRFALTVGCGLLGLTPWIYVNLAYHHPWFEYVGNRAAKLNGPAGRLADFFAQVLPASAQFKNAATFNGLTLGRAYFILAAAIVILFVATTAMAKRRVRSTLRAPRFMVHVALLLGGFALAYVSSSFAIGPGTARDYRYLVLFYPFLFIALAAMLDRLWSGATAFKATAGALAACFCVLGCVGMAAMIDPGHSNRRDGAPYRAYDYSVWLPRFLLHYIAQTGDRPAWLAPPDARRTAVFFNRCAGDAQPPVLPDPAAFLAGAAALGEERDGFLEGLGAGVGGCFLNDPSHELKSSPVLPAPREGFWEARGRQIGMKDAPDWSAITAAAEQVEPAHRTAFVRGVGRAAGCLFCFDPTAIVRLLKERPDCPEVKLRQHTILTHGLDCALGEPAATTFRRGLGYGMAPYLYVDETVTKLALLWLQAADRKAVWDGMCAFFRETGAAPPSAEHWGPTARPANPAEADLAHELRAACGAASNR